MKTPELNKLTAISGDSQKIGAFLDWLFHEQKIELAKTHSHAPSCDDGCGCGYRDGELEPVDMDINRLLASYFDIDLKRVEDERRKLLEKLQKSHENTPRRPPKTRT